MFFKVSVMKELILRSRIWGFLMEVKDLLGGNLDLAPLSLSFIDISMLLYMLYGEYVKLSGLNYFWTKLNEIPDLIWSRNSLRVQNVRIS